MKYSFDQLVEVPMLQKLMDDFYMVTGIPSGICDNKSHMFTATGWKRVCTQFHRVNPVTLEQCLKSDQYILDHLHEGPFVGYRCPHGLNDYAVPLFIEGEHLANVMTGQMFHEEPDLEFFRQQARQYGFEESDYLKAVREIPIVPRERVAHIMSFLISLTEALAKMGLSQLHRLEIERQRLEEAHVLAEERKKATQAIRQSNDMLTQVINSVPQAIFWKGLDYRYLGCNKIFADTVGLDSPSDIIGKSDFDLPWPAEEAETYQAFDREIFESKQPRLHFIEPVQRADGARLVVDTSKVPLFDAQGGLYAVLGVYDDITEQRRMQEVMIHTEKMMSVGGLAAGMAHEINNPLGGVLQSAQVLAARLGDELPANLEQARNAGCDFKMIRAYMEKRGVFTLLDSIRESAFRAATIVRNMLEFSRKSESRKEFTALSEVLDKALELISNDYDLKKKYDFRHVDIRKQYAPDLPPVYCARIEIEQVVLNLLKNAIQAMSLKEYPDSRPTIALSTARDEDRLVFVVEDNGPGMEDFERRQIFEPFFTTKAPGKGTGLGLSVAYFIVANNHGGSIDVESHPGNWTRFTVKLPLVQAPLSADQEKRPAP